VVFAGIRGEIGIPSYDFLSISATQAVKRLFLRDHHRSWYHLGVQGLAGSVDELTDALRRMIDDTGVQRVAMVGNSAGGYAALLYAGLLGADAALAFSPRTSFGWSRRLMHRDFRYRNDAVRLTLRGLPGRRYRDLRETPAATRSRIHYSKTDRLDTWHAERMRGLPGYEIHSHLGGGHQLVRELRDRGELAPLLSEVLATRRR
jgi:pimeloyl-ACP methyl ester carboxylesterase